jgi:hypothetical protein
MSRRADDFSEFVKRTLAQRVGYICSNPKHRAATSGPHTSPDKSIIIGVAAHITAAQPGGPRYDPALSKTQRKSPENGIWLCADCAKLIDSDMPLYTREILLSWKQQAEGEQFQKISEATLPYGNQADDREKLELIKSLMRRAEGAGVKIFLDPGLEIYSGTIAFRIFIIDLQEDMKILDFIGGITKNRISLTLRHNRKAQLTILDSQGTSSTVTFLPKQSRFAAQVVLTWHQCKISLRWMTDNIIIQSLSYPVGGRWLAAAQGIDIDGNDRASYIVQGVSGGGILGLGLCASSKRLQVIISDFMVFERVLTDNEIHTMIDLHSAEVQS